MSPLDACPSVKRQLTEVIREIDAFEAKKLADHRRALEDFVKEQEKLASDYTAKYQDLRKRWCQQAESAVQLTSAIKCAFPKPPHTATWKDIIRVCICPERCTETCLGQLIDKRKRCASGPLERARDVAKWAFDEATASLGILKGLVKGAEGRLTANELLIKDVRALIPTADAGQALYPLFFKLIPALVALAPSDDDGKRFTEWAEEYGPDVLCDGVTCKACEPEDGACTPPRDGEPSPTTTCTIFRAPRLIPPPSYLVELDCAWDCVNKTRDSFAGREAEYKEAPDDVESLKKRKRDEKALDEAIKKCVKDHQPKDNCGGPTPTATREA